MNPFELSITGEDFIFTFFLSQAISQFNLSEISFVNNCRYTSGLTNRYEVNSHYSLGHANRFASKPSLCNSNSRSRKERDYSYNYSKLPRLVMKIYTAYLDTGIAKKLAGKVCEILSPPKVVHLPKVVPIAVIVKASTTRMS